MFLAVDGADAMYASRVLADDRCAGSPRARGLDYRWRTHAKRAERWRARCRARWRAAPPLSAEMLSAEGSRGRVDWLCGSGGGFARRPRMATAARADCAVACEPPCTRTGWALRLSSGRAGPRGRLLSRARWAPEMRGAHTVCRRLRGYWRVLCLSVACERDIISVVSSKPISARHTSPIPQRYHPRGARSRRRGGDARGTVSACTTAYSEKARRDRAWRRERGARGMQRRTPSSSGVRGGTAASSPA